MTYRPRRTMQRFHMNAPIPPLIRLCHLKCSSPPLIRPCHLKHSSLRLFCRCSFRAIATIFRASENCSPWNYSSLFKYCSTTEGRPGLFLETPLGPPRLGNSTCLRKVSTPYMYRTAVCEVLALCSHRIRTVLS